MTREMCRRINRITRDRSKNLSELSPPIYTFANVYLFLLGPLLTCSVVLIFKTKIKDCRLF